MEITDRQLEIIEATGKILTNAGVSGLTIKNLAKEMRFSESAIYRHFESKEDIIIALLQYLVQELDRRFTAAIHPDMPPEEKFATLFRTQVAFFNSDPHYVVAVFSDGLMEESQRINQVILQIMGIMMKHLMPVIMEGQQRKVFTNAIPTEELIHIVLGSFRLQMFKWRIANFRFDIRRNGDNMIDSLLTLIRNTDMKSPKQKK